MNRNHYHLRDEDFHTDTRYTYTPLYIYLHLGIRKEIRHPRFYSCLSFTVILSLEKTLLTLYIVRM